METENSQTSLRQDLEAAMETVAEREAEEKVVPETPEASGVTDEIRGETPEQKATRERDEAGRFKKSEKKDEKEGLEVEAEAQPLEAAPTDLKPPQSLKGEIKAKWKDVPDFLKREFIRLEGTQAKGMAKIAQTAKFGEEVMAEVQPYMAMIQSEGSDARTAIRSLLNTAYLMRTAPPAQKQQLFFQLAQKYGVDLSNQPQQQRLDPNLQYVLGELQQLKQQQSGQLTAQTQAQEQEIMGEIQAFASDPAHPYFEEVKGDMAYLLQLPQGGPKNLDDAYERACWANPEIRKSILADQRKAEEAKRKEELQKSIAGKKVAASSLKSDPTGATPVPDGGDLRATISSLYYGDSKRI